jgi:hypothetical protein
MLKQVVHIVTTVLLSVQVQRTGETYLFKRRQQFYFLLTALTEVSIQILRDKPEIQDGSNNFHRAYACELRFLDAEKKENLAPIKAIKFSKTEPRIK